MSAAAAATRPSLPAELLLAAWLALAAGLFETALLLFKRYGLGTLVLVNPHVVWMAPVVYAVLFVLVTLLLRPLARRLPRVFTFRTTTWVLAFLGAYSALQVVRVELWRPAIALLALGVATQVARLAARQDALLSLARRSAPWLVAAAVLAAGGRAVGLALSERRALAALPAAPDRAPNVLLLILDTVRALNLSAYGYQRPTTPRLDSLARKGALFERAVSTTSWTGPSHASLFTGQFPHRLSADWSSGLDRTHPTLAEVLRDRGWVTGGFAANTRYVSRQMGMARGFIHFEDYQAGAVGAVLETTWGGRLLMGAARLTARVLGDPTGLTPLKRAPRVLDPLLDWLDDTGDGPYFAAVNLMDAHSPYLAPREFAARFGVPQRRSLVERIRSRLERGPAPSAAARQSAWLERQHDLYDACIAYLDHQLGRLLDQLEGRGLLTNTIVILTSDHGEEFGEHGTVTHGHSLYWPALHVPLVIWYPERVPAGTRVEHPVSLREVPATVAELTGIGSEPPFPGLPLTRFWTDSAPAPDTVLAELTPPPGPRGPGPVGRGPMKSLVAGNLHYIRNGDGSEELYDVAADPLERNNLVALTDPATLEAFRSVLTSLQERRNP